MSSILAYVDLTLVGYVAVFVGTLTFSQKIKDFFSGVPSEVRAGMASVEAKVKADIKSAQASVLAALPILPPAKPPVAPAAPAAPAA